MSSTTTQNQNMNVIVSFEGKPNEYLSAKLAWELNIVSMAKETIKVVDRHISQIINYSNILKMYFLNTLFRDLNNYKIGLKVILSLKNSNILMTL